MTRVALHDHLPLTCTREGTCCHGKLVHVNPWEIASLAVARGMPVAAFRDACVQDGVVVRFDGPPGWRGLPACSQFDASGRGCRAHAGRPLACRLYPLGRERRAGGHARYIHEGRGFPCRSACPSVDRLPSLRVEAYLADQQVAMAEAVQDAYVELMQDLAEGAFVLVFDSGLARRSTAFLAAWTDLVQGGTARAAAVAGPIWFDRLTVPLLDPADGRDFVSSHRSALQMEAQASFACLSDESTLVSASLVMLALALLCAHGTGAEASAAGAAWLARARSLAS